MTHCLHTFGGRFAGLLDTDTGLLGEHNMMLGQGRDNAPRTYSHTPPNYGPKRSWYAGMKDPPASDASQGKRIGSEPMGTIDWPDYVVQDEIRKITDDVIAFDFLSTSIAELLVAASAKGVVAIIMREQRNDVALVDELQRRFPAASLQHAPVSLKKWTRKVERFVEHPLANLVMPLDIRGTEFQRRVWSRVLEVPFGRTTTFAAIAAAVGSPRAVRAVGNACTKNPLEFAIPCHRVLRSDGSFSGGSEWGDRRQATMVKREHDATRHGKTSR
jgi:O-6-methylguanine DNA methyltransferase